jgi:hypothetical protein
MTAPAASTNERVLKPSVQLSIRARIINYLKEHHDEDLTITTIQQDLGLKRSQVQMALYGIRSEDAAMSPHIELGGRDRAGHVRFYTNLSERPLKSSARNPAATGSAGRKRTHKKSAQLTRPVPVPEIVHELDPEPEREPAPVATRDNQNGNEHGNGRELRKWLEETMQDSPTSSPSFLPVGSLPDGRVILASPVNPGVLLVAEPYTSILDKEKL